MPVACREIVVRTAEAAYPEEGCGLLVGTRRAGGCVWITQAVPARNCAPAPRTDLFEVDPASRLALMRRLRGTPEEIVGHFHSHPDAPAEPSARDAEMVFEPDLLWLLVSVAAGRARDVRAFRWESDDGRFHEAALETVPGGDATDHAGNGEARLGVD